VPNKRTLAQPFYKRRRRQNLLYSARLVGFQISTKQRAIFIDKQEFNIWMDKGINTYVHQLINDFGFTVKINNL